MIGTMEKLLITVIGAVSLVAVYGFLSMARAGCDEPIRPSSNEESTTLYIITNGFLRQKSGTYATTEECEKEGAWREWRGKIRDFSCAADDGLPGWDRGEVRPD
jgi:hypothetical protein